MIKRIIEISAEPMHLSVRNGQLRLRKHDDDENPPATIPCEDIGVLVIEHPQVTFTQSVISTLSDMGAAVVFCGRDHLPVSLALPFSKNTEVVSRLTAQINATKPIQKQLWKQLVVAKINAQAINLDHDLPAQRHLISLAREVRSDDPKNVEATAARKYWSSWLSDKHKTIALPKGKPFRRDIDEKGLNALLNYGYSILRAGIARALVSAGLHPALGVHHKNRSNTFALADDLIEPIRPFADRAVQDLAFIGRLELNHQTKKPLLGLLHQTVKFKDTTGPLMVVMHRYTASFFRCLKGEQKKLDLPTSLYDGDS